LAPIFALLFAVGVGRWRPSVIVLCAVFAAEVWPSGQYGNGKPVLEQQHLVNLLLVAGIAAVALAAPWIVERWNSSRGDIDVPPAGRRVALAD
jgi:hypothetical protein